MRRPTPVAVFIVPLLTLFLALVSGHRVFTAPLWGDEFRTWRDGIEKPLHTVLTWQHNPDHAPLGHLLARAGAAIFGVEHAWALRLGAWLCGLACVPAIYLMGRTLGRTTGEATGDATGAATACAARAASAVGCLMAAMLAVDPNINFQISQARMYAPLLLGAIVSITLAGSILLRPERPWRRAIGLGVALAVGIWSHSQIYALLIALLVVALALLARDRRTACALLASIAIACSIGAQGIWKIAHRHNAEAVEAADVTDRPGGQLEDAVNKVTGKSWITAIVAAGTAGGLVVIARRPNGPWLAALLVGVVGMAMVDLLVAARYRPVAHARYLMITQPALWFALATLVIELLRTPQTRVPFGIAGALTLAGLSVFEFTRALNALEDHPLADPFARLARDAHGFVERGDRFVVVPRLPFAMYSRYYGLMQDVRLDGALMPGQSMRQVRSRLNQSAIGRKTVYMLCAVPPHNIPYANPMDDPRTLARMVAEAKDVAVDPLPTLERGASWQAVLIRVDEGGTHIVAERLPEDAVAATVPTSVPAATTQAGLPASAPGTRPASRPTRKRTTSAAAATR